MLMALTGVNKNAVSDGAKPTLNAGERVGFSFDMPSRCKANSRALWAHDSAAQAFAWLSRTTQEALPHPVDKGKRTPFTARTGEPSERPG